MYTEENSKEFIEKSNKELDEFIAKEAKAGKTVVVVTEEQCRKEKQAEQ